MAADVRRRMAVGDIEGARAVFGDLIALHQRRAVRIAFHYLRDPDETDDAVQDAFVRAFVHIGSYRDEFPFEVWFTRILVNRCLDLRKSRARRMRWLVPDGVHTPIAAVAASSARSAEERLLSQERMGLIARAVSRLPTRQRAVFVLRHVADQSPAEVSHVLQVSEATVRVHLHRAVRQLQRWLSGSVARTPRPSRREGLPGRDQGFTKAEALRRSAAVSEGTSR